MQLRRLKSTILACLVGSLALLAVLGAATASAAEAPRWDVITRAAPTNLPPGGKGEIVAVIVNLGDAPVFATSANPVQITDKLPPGLVATGKMQGYAARGDNNLGQHSEEVLKECATLPELRCPYIGTLPPFIAIEVQIPVEVASNAGADGEQNEVKVEGGGVAPKSIARPIKVSAAPTPFGVERYELSPEEEDGSPAVQAGAHPFQLTTTIELNQTLERDPNFESSEKPPKGYPSTPGLLRNLTTTLPAGLVADARASVFPQCTAVAFAVLRSGNSNECPSSTAIGAAVVTFKEELHFRQNTATVPVFNLVPEAGEPARFGFIFEKVPVILDTALKTGNGYAVEVKVENTSQAAELLSSVVTVWGVPGDKRHAASRGWECLGGGIYVEGLEPRPPCPAATLNPPPYLIMPTTACNQTLNSSVSVQTWTQPAFGPEVPASELESLQGCERLPFDPTINAQPDQHEASTPTGLNVEVHVPQDTTLSTTGVAEADVKSTTVTLPEGMLANGGAADGLNVCSTLASGFESSPGSLASDADTGATLEGETGAQFFTSAENSCPGASKVGTVKIKTPLLENELTGYVYFAQQNTNPFASPLVLYLMAEDKESGVRVKLAGEVKIDQSTGQLTSVFRNTPPVPFELLTLHLTNGPRATQTTPAFCGRQNVTAARFAPSTEEASREVTGSSSFTLTPNTDGEPCPSQGPLPFSPSFQAGSATAQAGGFTPFTLTIRRPDGDQALQSITMHMPPGLAAVLASVTPCPEPQAANNQCGPDSLIGHSTASSGLGSAPVTLGGDVYLTGPYKGAPFGLLAVTHAIAGPLNLGDVPVRSAITIDPFTAAVTVTSDPLPQFVKGAPSQIKVLNVTVDKPGFEFNPTNCSQMAVTGTLNGYEGGSASVSTPFHASNCAALPFTPKLTASAGGHGSKVGGTGFNVNLTSAGLGQAGIAKVFLTIPKILPSRLTTIQKACVDKVFEANPAACDEGSNIGKATIHTPVFKNPLTGPAYLVSHGNAAFPDVEFVLQGEGVTIILDGKTDIKKGVTYSRFESSPDAPFTSFETSLPAGPHSALTINTEEGKNYNICGKKITMPTVITGQNGVVINSTTNVAAAGCGAVKGFKVTRAQQLQKALKACRKKFKHNKGKRASCEARAKKKYGAKKKSGKKKAAKKKKKKK
ncbi:MAG TPA: hypothetical protein VHW67_13690 [Solirubrobacteraceae bacterium]|jgi:hypothetical protein|nr:hypothetical protein [Solirubrobacteraceae bacterium]